MSGETVADLRLYDYLPYKGRPKIAWPGGAQIAVWVAPNVEFYEYSPPTNPQRTPWARPLTGRARLFSPRLRQPGRASVA